MVNYEKDYCWGAESEIDVKPLLEKQFGPLQSGDRYSKFDFFNDRFNIELKTRKVAKDMYHTTMIQSNKFVCDNTRELVLAFKFTDGLYYIKYDRNLFNRFETRLFSRAKLAFDMKPHCYIPTVYLTQIPENVAEVPATA